MSRLLGVVSALGIYLLLAVSVAVAQVACTADFVPGVVVQISDSKTGAPLADSALAIAREKEYADTLDPFEYTSEGPLGSQQGAGERAGTYDVIVTRPGYVQWRAHGVRVAKDECHVKTVFLEARLRPLR